MHEQKNIVQLVGHVGADAEIKTTETGKKLAQFSLATSEVFQNAKGETVKQTQWHRLVAWGKMADTAAKYALKGSEVSVEGKLVHRNYNDKEGNKKYITEIQVNELSLLTKSPQLGSE